MKAFAVLAPQTIARWRQSPTFRTQLHGTPVAFALVEQEDIDFSRTDSAHAESVLVRVHAFSCNYREKGRVLYVSQQAAWRGYVVIGSEFAGTVVKVGSRVDDFHPGDAVCGNGSVELGTMRPGLTTQRASVELQIHDRSKLFKLPHGMSFEEGAAFSIGAQTAYSMVDRLSITASEHVAVTAASSNTSLFAIQALRARGHSPHALTTSTRMAGHLRKLGIEGICLVRRDADATDQIRRYLGEQGLTAFDAVVDPFCDIYLRKLLPVVRRFGRYVTCGIYEQFKDKLSDDFVRAGLNDTEVMSALIRKSITLIGNNLGTTDHLLQASADYTARRLSIGLDTVVSDGNLTTLVERTFLTPDRSGKVVFDYRSSEESVAARA